MVHVLAESMKNGFGGHRKFPHYILLNNIKQCQQKN